MYGATPVVHKRSSESCRYELQGKGLLHVRRSKEVIRNRSWRRLLGGEKGLEFIGFFYLMEEGLGVTKEHDDQRIPLDKAVAAGNERIMGLFERKK